MDKEKIICLMHKCHELSKAIADLETKVDKMNAELSKTLQGVFEEYAKAEKENTKYVSC